MTGREKLTKGDFNYMSQVEQPDGSLLVTMTKRGESVKYRLVVKNLYEPNEKVYKDEVISG